MINLNHQDKLVIADVYLVDLFDENGTYRDRSFTVDYQMAEGSLYGMALDA
jgi:hypothetical protein